MTRDILATRHPFGFGLFDCRQIRKSVGRFTACNLSEMTRFFCLLISMASLLMLLPAHSENAGGDDSQPWVKSRARVIIDNDFGGDPDGLFQLAHQLLSPSVEVRGIIGSHHYPKGFYGYAGSSEQGVEMAKELLDVMGLGGKIPVFQGANERIKDLSSPAPSEAAQFIIRESMRSDVSSPLYVVCGAGLTDLASAWLIEPKSRSGSE